MARILLLLVIVYLVYLVFRGFFRAQVKKAPPPEAQRAAEDMIKCARCGVNLPRSEAHQVDGKLVCVNNPQCHA
jgi:uncharacterized protein